MALHLKMVEKALVENRGNIRLEAERMGVNLEWACERRRAFLESIISCIKNQRQKLISFLAGSNPLDRGVIKKFINNSKKIIEDCEKRIRLLIPAKSNNGITDEMIQRAKQYPISELLAIPIRGNVTNCIAHEDKNPSMNIKNNWAYCYACGFRGDSISVYMHLNGVDFNTAVKNLNQCVE
jgi:hypothetical protein